MKKTLLITLDYLPQTGGVANYWAGLNHYLPSDLFFILAPQVKDYNILEKNIIRKKILFDFFWPRWLKLLFIILKLQKEQRFKNFIAGQILPIGTVLWFLKRINLIENYYVSCHGFDILHLQGRKKFIAQLVMNSAKKIIVNSDFTGKVASRYQIKEDKIFVIKPCPQLSLLSLSLQVKQSEKINSTYNLITVSRLVPRKGIDRVIQALPYVWQKLPQVKYQIVGAGEDIYRLKKMCAEIKAKNQVVFFGKLTNEEIAKLYQAQDLFVMLPHNIKGDIEGFGMVYLEAGLFNLPVLATDSGGVSEAVRHLETGIILPEDSSAKIIAETIVNLFNQPAVLKKYGENNKQWARSFSWQKQALLLEKLLA